MKILLTFLLLTVALGAQEGFMTWLTLNKPHRLIADKVQVRSAPDAKAAVKVELPLGYEVVPVEQTSSSLTIDGVEAPWYKVRYRDGRKNREGFIWGNLIARAFAKSDKGELFLFGTARRQQPITEGTEYTSQVRVVQDGRQLAQLEVKEGTSFEAKHEAKLTNGRGLEGVQNIFTVKFIQEYCGGKGNTIFFFWDGKEISHAHSSVDGSDAPHYATEKQIFPADKGGRNGYVILEQEYGDHDDPKSVKKEKILLKWNGKKLHKTS